MKLKKCTTILLALVFIATIILSLTFIAENFHHDCTGDDCVICQMIETAEDILGGGKTAETDAVSGVFKINYTESDITCAEPDCTVISTPVSLNDLLTI